MYVFVAVFPVVVCSFVYLLVVFFSFVFEISVRSFFFPCFRFIHIFRLSFLPESIWFLVSCDCLFICFLPVANPIIDFAFDLDCFVLISTRPGVVLVCLVLCPSISKFCFRSWLASCCCFFRISLFHFQMFCSFPFLFVFRRMLVSIVVACQVLVNIN